MDLIKCTGSHTDEHGTKGPCPRQLPPKIKKCPLCGTETKYGKNGRIGVFLFIAAIVAVLIFGGVVALTTK
jgi:hypothetical protein